MSDIPKKRARYEWNVSKRKEEHDRNKRTMRSSFKSRSCPKYIPKIWIVHAKPALVRTRRTQLFRWQITWSESFIRTRKRCRYRTKQRSWLIKHSLFPQSLLWMKRHPTFGPTGSHFDTMQSQPEAHATDQPNIKNGQKLEPLPRRSNRVEMSNGTNTEQQTGGQIETSGQEIQSCNEGL